MALSETLLVELARVRIRTRTRTRAMFRTRVKTTQ